jgi:hypothetical protein
MSSLGLSTLLMLSCLSAPTAAEKPADKADKAEPAASVSALAHLPVKEITVFKDGHAFVLHQGLMPVDAAGHVVLDNLPNPVIGTFWPYAMEKNAKLHSVVAGRRVVRLERTALTLRELLEGNIGADVILSESNLTYQATILGFLTRSAQEVAATAPPNSGEVLAEKSNLLLVKTGESLPGPIGEVKLAEGTRVVPLERIQDVRFLTKLKTKSTSEEFRNLLTLKLDWAGGKPGKTAEVGMAYLQKGVRWIPNYRVELDGKGKAVVKLQATLLNELTDLDNVTMHLVVGVPSFMFKDTTDPIALNQVVAQLSQHFQESAKTGHAFSNAIMTQTARMTEVRNHHEEAPRAGADLGPDVAGAGKNEDLFIFTLKNVTLKKGQRMVVPVSEFTLDYKDVYTLEVPYAPPPEVQRHIRQNQQAELTRLLNAPKMVHKVRLFNKSGQPLTTAPTLIVRDGRLLAQGLMTYTSNGAASDLTLTTAVDVKVSKTEKETRRTPAAAKWEGTNLQRVDLTGTLSLTNHRQQAVEVEIVRYVLGNVNGAGQDGKSEMLNALEEDSAISAEARPAWWGWYSWPAYWNHFNGIGRFAWKQKIEPGKSIDLTYNWYYYWP